MSVTNTCRRRSIFAALFPPILFVLMGLTGALCLHPQTVLAKVNRWAEQGEVSGAASAVMVLQEASELLSYARENESALAMLTAVQVIERALIQSTSEKIGTRNQNL